MLKSILPAAKRTPGIDSPTTVAPSSTACPPEGKENSRPGSLPQRSPAKSSLPTAPRSYDGRRGQGQQQQIVLPSDQSQTTDRDFEKLLDDLQIPTTLRPKLATLDPPVKAALLRSSQALASPDPTSPTLRSPRQPTLRRSLSTANLDDNRPMVSGGRDNVTEYRCPPGARATFSEWDDGPLATPVAPFMLEGPARPSSGLGGHIGRSSSLDLLGSTPRNVEISGGGSTKASLVSKSTGKGSTAVKDMSPGEFCRMLSETSSALLEVEVVKKLRLLLRNEAASWSESFLRQGGYAALITRLIDILDIEWREEQHDDKILHELLRCFKALSTSSIGCFALRSSCPTPFVQLVSLLYSDKKPGDLCTRQLIIDLLQVIFYIYPTTTSRLSGGQNVRQLREEPISQFSPSLPSHEFPSPHETLYSLVRALLLTPAPPPTEAPSIPVSPHAFIASLHLPRIFKSYLQELSDICRDYFWVFCHPQNTIWHLEQTDEAKAIRPRAPGGMTGGVEFEAMGYLAGHFQLINSLATAALDLGLPPQDEYSAHRFHSDLFASGMERIILTTRKASATYYVTLHLEIARYIALAIRARYDIPWSLSRLIGPPPSTMVRGGAKSGVGSLRTSPVKGSMVPSVPSIPTPTKIEPIKF